MLDSAHFLECEDEDCITCRDRRERYEAKARERALARAFRLAQEQDPDDNATLEDFK